MARNAGRQRQTLDLWPGFVDALAALLMVIIFLVMVFTVAQFFLSETLMGRDKALDDLNRQISLLSEELAGEQGRIARLQEDLAGRNDTISRLITKSRELERLLDAEREQLAAARGEAAARARTVERTRAELADERAAAAAGRRLVETLARQIAQLREDIAGYKETLARAERRSAELIGLLASERARAGRAEGEAEAGARALAGARAELASEREAGARAGLRIAEVTRELADIRGELARLNAALEASEASRQEQEVEIATLTRRLQQALVSKVAELARYRSEFFGRLREVLGDDANIRVVGDRFVFQSEILFESGSARFNRPALGQVDRLAETLREVTARIPESIDWVLRVDGHTDRVPISTPQYPSNWELSAARAISLVRALIDRGLPARRLVAAGFGDNYPLDPGDTAEAYSRNRRIELKLTQR